MLFDKSILKASAGEEITLILNHTGQISKEIMGHNFVLLKNDTDVDDFAQRAMIAKDNQYIPEGDETTIVHGDYRIGNTICEENNFLVKVVLDWELSTLGNPFADLGYFLYAHYIPYGERHGLKGANLDDLNIPSVTELVKEYCKVRNIKVFDPTFYVVLSLFRSISILEGVYARYVNGNAVSYTHLTLPTNREV